ncbi:MAG TPA: hypothetical protein VLU99_03400 [Nitrososphaerales archaeon]|nr:hypothetical protein [Nitrososphaerales archaeon]HUK74814.1 hypothetical protein [Nitrososphaerales archaeon]
MRPVALVGWSRAGRFEDLERGAMRKLSLKAGEGDRIDDSLVVETEDPVALARSLSFFPGVAWVAVGHRFEGMAGYLREVDWLAKRYLSRSRRFRISATVDASVEAAGDMVLAGNSEVLSTVKGAKVDERDPQVVFRASASGRRGACGVEIRRGPGGSPTSGEWAACLASGGERSSAVAWMAALAGYSVRLVHSRTDDSALRQVAKLYSELSNRMDPQALDLVVLEGGGDPIGRVGGWLAGHRGVSFTGWVPEKAEVAKVARRFPGLVLPLLLADEGSVRAVYASLNLGRPKGPPTTSKMSLKGLEVMAKYSKVRFGGVQADQNVVIDAIKRTGHDRPRTSRTERTAS